MRKYWITATLLAVAMLMAPSLSAQERGPLRRLAPGVVTTIPATPEVEETFSGPRPMIELTLDRNIQDWEPHYSPQSATLQEIANQVVFRRRIEQVEFSFKPLRIIEVDFPQPDGSKQRKLIWYMIYRLRNTGGHLQPVGGAYTTADTFELRADDDGNPIFEFSNNDASAQIFPQEKMGTREVDLPIWCIPSFVLEVHEEGQPSVKAYLDRIIPNALEAIRQREDPNLELLNSVEIGQQPIQVSSEQEDKSVWGVAMWEDIDPTTDYLSIFIQGLSNAILWEDPDQAWNPGDPLGSGREFTYKTLQLNYWRPGDAIDEHYEEIRYGFPGFNQNKETEHLLGVYGLEEPLDYLWIYR